VLPEEAMPGLGSSRKFESKQKTVRYGEQVEGEE
jgi:hypothetical protein